MSASSTTPAPVTTPRRERVASRTKLDFWFDAVILAVFRRVHVRRIDG